MKIKDLMRAIEAIGYPVAYQQFIATEEEPVPSPPFIIYVEDESDNFGADNKVWAKVIAYEIELYSDYRRFDIEAQIEKILDDNSIFYETRNVPIKSERLHQRVYAITLIKK